MNLGLVGHYSVDNISRIQNRPIYGLNVNVSLVMEFLDMTFMPGSLQILVSSFFVFRWLRLRDFCYECFHLQDF